MQLAWCVVILSPPPIISVFLKQLLQNFWTVQLVTSFFLKEWREHSCHCLAEGTFAFS
jgi:hypothetical protein